MKKIIPLNWNWSKDYFDMLYVIFEAMEGEEIAIFAQKSIILDGRRRGNVIIKPPQPPSWSWVGDEAGG